MNLSKKTVGISLALTVLLGFGSQAVAQDYRYAQDPGYAPPPVVYGAPPPMAGRPLTVVRRNAYDPYSGPKAVVTAPIHVAGELVALPFRVVNAIFPPRGNTPLVVVGAPVYAAGRVAQVPFDVLQAPFGGPAPFQNW